MLFYLYLSHPQKQSKVSIDSRPGSPYGGLLDRCLGHGHHYRTMG